MEQRLLARTIADFDSVTIIEKDAARWRVCHNGDYLDVSNMEWALIPE